MEKVVMRTSHTATGFCCDCELLPGWVVAGPKNWDRFKDYVQESIDFFLECAREDGDEYPAVFDGEYEVEYKMDACALLAYYQGFITFSGLEKFTGINQKQLAHYAAGRSFPRKKQEERIIAGLHSLGHRLLTVSF